MLLFLFNFHPQKQLKIFAKFYTNINIIDTWGPVEEQFFRVLSQAEDASPT